MMVKSILWVGYPMGSNYFRLAMILMIAGLVGVLVGCQTNKNLVTSFAPDSTDIPTPGPSYLQPSDPNLPSFDSSINIASLSPDSMIDYRKIEYTPITLSECISRALQDSEVFRDLGGTIVFQASAIDTTLDPALQYTNPTFGEDAALSAFDANLVTGLFFENNDRPFNNRFSGNTDGLLTQDLGEYNFEISKLAATGTLFTSRTRVNYDANNQAGNRFGSAWEAIIDSGFRQPLLQGSGSLFNRIAGPSQVPGTYNGVLIARTNTEMSVAEFEESSREFVSNVENAYWDLYYAYRELNAQTEARDAALQVLKKTQAQAENERISGLEQASADEQYLRFESAIIESLEGRLIQGTQVDSGSSGGTFRRTVGVRVAERRLRYIIGMPITDGTLLKPADQPGRAASVYDWDDSVSSALSERPELRRQRWLVKQKELELTAARNFLLPRLDLVGNYRFRGLGKDLTGGGTSLQDDIDNGTDMSDAFSDLSSGNFQEVQIGAELRMPVGYRRANAAVKNAELFVQRERAILKEQERLIVLNLSNAIAEARRAHSAMIIAEKRFKAAEKYRAQAAARIDSGRSQMDVLLESQRRMLEAQIQFINAEVDYVLAIKNIHYEKGTFLQYHGVSLSESQSNPRAYIDYDRRASGRKSLMSYVVRDASISNAPLADAVGTETMPFDFFDAAADMSVDPSVPVTTTEIPLGTGVEAPAEKTLAPSTPESRSPTPAAPVEGAPVQPPTGQDSQTDVYWNPPPSASRARQTGLPSSTIESTESRSSNRFVLSDVTVGEQPELKTANAASRNMASLSQDPTVTTRRSELSNGEKGFQLVGIPTSGVRLRLGSSEDTPQAESATSSRSTPTIEKLTSEEPISRKLTSEKSNTMKPIKMKLSSETPIRQTPTSEASINGKQAGHQPITENLTSAKPLQRSVSKKPPGFTVLQPMPPAAKSTSDQQSQRRLGISTRISDANSADMEQTTRRVR